MLLSAAMLCSLCIIGFSVTANTAKSNVTGSDFQDVFGTGAVISQDAKGVKITSTTGSQRATFTSFNPVDGMVISFVDVQIPQPSANGQTTAISLNVGPAAGHFWGSSDTEGLFIKVFTEYVQDQRKTYMYVKKANDMDAAGDDIYLSPTEITGLENNMIPSAFDIRFEKIGEQYHLYFNQTKFTLPAAAVESNIKADGTALINFGGYSDVPGNSGVSYVIQSVGEPNVIKGTPVAPVIGVPNVQPSRFEDTFGIGISMSEHEKGVKIVSNANNKRATYNQLTQVDGMILRFTDIAVPELTENDQSAVLAFTLSTEAGHYWGMGAAGVHFRLYSAIKNGKQAVYFYIKKADDMDDAGDDIILPPTRLDGFVNGKLPSDVEITFTKEGDVFKISVNGIVAEVAASKILDNINAQGKSLVTIGGYSLATADKEVSFVVNHIGAEAIEPPVETTTTDKTHAESTTGTVTTTNDKTSESDKLPDTGVEQSTFILCLLTLAAGIVLVSGKKLTSAK